MNGKDKKMSSGYDEYLKEYYDREESRYRKAIHGIPTNVPLKQALRMAMRNLRGVGNPVEVTEILKEHLNIDQQ